ncbi:phosphohistidine phosphatase, partial [Campylobacter sp. FMV-PI01]
MKKIYFLRHAKAKKEGVNDFLRKLSNKGKDDALALKKRLKQNQIIGEAIFTSSSVRTLTTSNLIFNDNIFVCDELYEITSINLLKFIQNIDDKFKNIFIVGHNPSITEICENLSDSIIGNIPTCGLFGIEFNVLRFKDIKPQIGEVLIYDY